MTVRFKLLPVKSREQYLVSEDEEELFARMSDLRSTFVDFLKQEGVDTPYYKISKLKRRLQKNFGNRIIFFANPQTVTEPELVTSALHVPQLLNGRQSHRYLLTF